MKINRLALAVLLACALPSAAQEFRATVSGTVADSSGAVIPNARIRVVNVETNVAVTTQSNEAGFYVVPALQPGSYRIETEVTGFKRYVRDGLVLQIQDRPVVDIVLEPGELSTTVNVTSEAQMLETTTASRGSVITGRTLVDLPLNGRNAFALAALEPGVAFTARGQGSALLRTTANAGISSLVVGGGQLRSNESLLDGVPNTGTDGLIQYVPSVDAAQEFRIQTNVFDAEYGRFTGGVINAAIRSGTNELHGTAFGFVRNSAFNARDPFAATIPQFGYTIFGFSLGGPVVLPKVYKGKDRTFWFVNYEGSREGVPRAFVATVPTAAQQAGDFSQTLVRSGANTLPVNVYDPFSTRQQGATFIRDQFPGNRIPASRIDPIGANLMKLYPAPNAAGDAVTAANNYARSFKDPVSDDGYVFKIDHRFSDKHAMFGRYSFRRFFVGRAGAFQNAVTGDSETRDAPGAAIDDTYTINPTTVLNIRYGFSRYFVNQKSDNLGVDQTALGFPPSLVSQLLVNALPAVNVSNGFQGLATAGKLNRSPEDSHTLRGTISKVMSSHTFRFGAEGRLLRSNVGNLGGAAAGSYSFDQIFTRGPNPQVAAVNAGWGLASLLLGVPASGSVANNAQTADSAKYYGFYLQDDWRVTRKISMNLGIRYEWEGAYTERYDRLNRGYDYFTNSPIAAAAKANYALSPIPEVPVSQFNVIGGLRFVGVNGLDRALNNPDRNNVAPRVGVAWEVKRGTVIRGGYGLFFGASTLVGESRNGFSVSTPMVSSVDGGLNPLNTLKNPFPTGLLTPTGSANGLMTLVGQGLGYTTPTLKMSRAQQFQIGVQHEFNTNLLLELSYVGARGYNLPVSTPINIIPESIRAQAEATLRQTGRNILNDSVANPFFGLIASGPLSTRTTTRGQLTRPYPHFTGLTDGGIANGSSRFDSGQAKLTRRMSNGFSLTGSYAWGKTLESTRYWNDQDGSPIKELSPNDIPHRAVFSGIYELPFGPGKALLGSSTGALARFVEGWQMTAIYTAQSGIPIDIGGAESLGRSAKLESGQAVNNWFDRTVFRLRQPLELVRTLRLPDVRSAGRNNWEISLLKTTTIYERLRLQFRAEAFNAFNRPEWSSPVTSFTAGNFGQVTSTNTFARQLQFGLKLLW